MSIHPFSPISLRPFFLLLFATVISYSQAQTLVGGSLYQRSKEKPTTPPSADRVWLSYEHHFSFKRGLSIDSEFDHQFYTQNRHRRLGVRSVLLANIGDNWRAGGGMGFFWDYGLPNVSQELRLIQEVQHYKDYGRTIVSHRLRFEEQITQALETGEDFTTRWRYEIDATFPTRSGIYFGVRNEIFSNITAKETSSFINMNRFSGFLGYNTFNSFRVEAQIMMEDTFHKLSDAQRKSWVFRIVARQTF